MHPFDVFPLALIGASVAPALCRAGYNAARDRAATHATRAAMRGFADGAVTRADPVSAALRAYGARRGVRTRRFVATLLRALAARVDAPSPF